MKLLIYSHFFAPSVGGVETIVLSIAAGLAAIDGGTGGKEFEVTLITQTAPENFDDLALPFRVIRKPGLLQLWRQVRAANVVHIAGPALAPLVFGLFAGKSVVLEHHGFQAICPNGQLYIEPLRSPCPGHFMAGRHAECIRCNSGAGLLESIKLWALTFVRRFLCSRVAANIAPTMWLGSLLDLPRVQPVPHGLEIISLASEPAREPGAVPLLVFQGRLVTTKGVHLVLQAARILRLEHRSFELLIIGGGPERKTLEELAVDWGLAQHVKFAGRLSAAELDSALARADLFVVPSLGGEVFGLVVAENMLRGLPIVASDLGAFVEVLGEGGLTFHTGDAPDLARQMAVLLDDQNFARRLSGLAHRRIVDFFNRSRMIQEHARIYREVVGAPKN